MPRIRKLLETERIVFTQSCIQKRLQENGDANDFRVPFKRSNKNVQMLTVVWFHNSANMIKPTELYTPKG